MGTTAALPPEFSARSAAVMADQGLWNDAEVRVGIEMPDYGGLYRDGDSVIVWLLRPDAQKTARLAKTLQAYDLVDAGLFAAGRVVVRDAKHRFIDLGYWRTLIPELPAASGITLLAVDDRTNTVLVGAESEARFSEIARQAAQAGIPAGALQIVVATASIADAATGMGAVTHTIQDRTDTPRAGYMITNPFFKTCTLGANAIHRETLEWYCVTASHCSSQIGVVEGTVLHQAVWGEGGIGGEVEEEAWFTGIGPHGYGCAWAEGCKIADAALYKYSARTPDSAIARPILNGQFLDFPDRWKLSGYTWWRLNTGTPLTFVGSQSGKRTGVIHIRCTDILYFDPTDGMRQRRWRCVDVATYFSQPGDSGGPLLWNYDDPGAMYIAGVHHGRVTISGNSYAVYTPMLNTRGALPTAGGYLYDH